LTNKKKSVKPTVLKQLKQKNKELLSIIQEYYEETGFSSCNNADLYWKAREVLGKRICSLKKCTGDGLIGDGWGDEYFCDCMTEKERKKRKI